MKKQVIIFLAILIAVYGVLTILDTGEYRVEKKAWRIQKQFAQIAEDPKAVPAAQYERLIKKYRDLIKKFPDSRYVPQFYSAIGALHVMNNEFDQARKVFGHAATQFKDNPRVASKAFMDVANVYIIEKKYKEAVDVYNRIWDNYSKTEVGFLAPFYIIRLYKSTGKGALADLYLKKSLDFYKNIALDESGPATLRMNAYQMLSNVYIGQKEWAAAIETSETMLFKFADEKVITPQRLRGITRVLNLVSIVQLKDFDRARGIYNKFIESHPGHYLNEYLEKVIESLNILEKKQLESAVAQQ